MSATQPPDLSRYHCAFFVCSSVTLRFGHLMFLLRCCLPFMSVRFARSSILPYFGLKVVKSSRHLHPGKMPHSVHSSREASPAGDDELGLLFWNCNMPRKLWTAECPEFLMGQAEKNQNILSSSDQDFKTMTWREVQYLVCEYNSISSTDRAASRSHDELLLTSPSHQSHRLLPTPAISAPTVSQVHASAEEATRISHDLRPAETSSVEQRRSFSSSTVHKSIRLPHRIQRLALWHRP